MQQESQDSDSELAFSIDNDYFFNKLQLFRKKTRLEDWEFFESHIEAKLEAYKEIFWTICVQLLKDYVCEAEKEMRLVSEARVALESEVARRRRDRSDIDIKINEICTEFESINKNLSSHSSKISTLES